MRQYTLEVVPKFPARVDAGAGIEIEKANGVYTFRVTGDNLAQSGVSDPANTDVLVFLPDGTPALVPLNVALAAVVPVEYPGRKNSFFNGGMLVWQRGGGALQGPAGTRTYAADRWAVTAAGAALSSVARNNHAGMPPRSGNIMEIIGNTGVTTVDVDQRMEAASPGGGTFSLGNQLVWAPQIAFSAYIFNSTGAAFTPTLFVETPTAADNWAASNVVNGGGAGEALQSCPNGTWTRVTWLGNPTAYANNGNGIAFRLRIPSGALDSNTKLVRITDVMVEPRFAADGLFSPFEFVDFGTELLRCMRYFQKTFPYQTKPAQNVGNTGAVSFTQAVGAAASQGGMQWRYVVKMRIVPTLTLFNPTALNAQARNEIIAADWTGTSISFASEDQVVFGGTTPAGSAVGQRNTINITADAEL